MATQVEAAMTHPNPVRVLHALVRIRLNNRRRRRGPHGGLAGRLEAKSDFVELMATGAPQYLVIKK